LMMVLLLIIVMLIKSQLYLNSLCDEIASPADPKCNPISPARPRPTMSLRGRRARGTLWRYALIVERRRLERRPNTNLQG
jgi:hypothetical protein